MPTDPRRGRCGGFTLIELLVTASIVAIAIGSIVAVFAGGLRVWEFIRYAGRSDGDLALASVELQRDLRNAVLPAGEDGAFEGQPDGLVFVAHPLPGGRDGDGTFRRVAYRWEAGQGVLLKREADWPEPAAARRRAAVPETALATGVERFVLEYESPEGRWADRWQQATGLPTRVRFTLVCTSRLDRVEMIQSVRLPTVPAERRP